MNKIHPEGCAAMRIQNRKGEPVRFLCMLLACMLFLSVLVSAAGEEETFSVGSKGNRVYEINDRLRELRYLAKKNVSKKYTDKTAEAVSRFQEVNGLPATGDADPATVEALFSDRAAAAPRETLPPLATPAPASEPDWPERDEEGFLAEEGEYYYENEDEGQWIYLSRNLHIEIRKVRDGSIPLEWFETEIWTRNGEALRTVMTNPERPSTKYRYPYDIAYDEGYVLAFSDDFYATRIDEKQTVGIIIREGKIIYDKTNKKAGHYLPNLDMLAQYPDGRLEVYLCNEYTAQELIDKGVVNVFSFGPILIRDGEINELLYQYYRNTEPRQAFGMIEPNHYYLLSILGRIRSSKGTMLQRVAEMMKAKGVTQALNLDGGNTLAIVFRGNILNRKATYRNRTYYRTVTSMMGFGHTESWGEIRKPN